MSTTTLPDGTMNRQLLPWGVQAKGAMLRREYRWVTWHPDAVSYQEAEAHLGTGGPWACVVMVHRGPQGGWSEARYVTRTGALPKPKLALRNIKGVPTGVPRTYYYGWVQMNETRAYLPLPKQDHDAYRAHLALHA